MKIQLFATWEELINEYNNEINNTQAQISNLNNQKQEDLNEYENYYNTSLNQYDEMQKQQQNYIDTYKQQQTDIQNKQTQYEIGLVNQNKEEAKKQTQKDIKGAYVDYMKATNQYGSNAEKLDEQGLSNSGYSETTQAMMFNTYQNRVGTAKEALTKANVQYDNQIQQALLTNDANLAQLALETMQQTYQLALQGFQINQLWQKKRLIIHKH